jgi:hypothetical protein
MRRSLSVFRSTRALVTSTSGRRNLLSTTSVNEPSPGQSTKANARSILHSKGHLTSGGRNEIFYARETDSLSRCTRFMAELDVGALVRLWIVSQCFAHDRNTGRPCTTPRLTPLTVVVSVDGARSEDEQSGWNHHEQALC